MLKFNPSKITPSFIVPQPPEAVSMLAAALANAEAVHSAKLAEALAAKTPVDVPAVKANDAEAIARGLTVLRGGEILIRVSKDYIKSGGKNGPPYVIMLKSAEIRADVCEFPEGCEMVTKVAEAKGCGVKGGVSVRMQTSVVYFK